MSLNQITTNNITNNKYLPPVYLSNTKTDALSFANSTISGYNPSSLSAYEELTLTPVWTNAPTSAVGTGKVKVCRVGNMVSACFDSLIGTVGSSSPITATAIIPARFCPVQRNVDIPIQTQSGATSTNGVMRVSTTGDLQVYDNASTDSPNWTSGSTTGWVKSGATWTTDSF